MSFNKKIVSKTQTFFKNKGIHVKTTEVYELFAHLSGYKNWHIASAKNAQFTDIIDLMTSPPETVIKQKFFIDTGEVLNISLFNDGKPNHLNVAGKIGSGKTELINNIIQQEVEKGDFIYHLHTVQQPDTMINKPQGKVFVFGEFEYTKVNFFDVGKKGANPTETKIEKIILALREAGIKEADEDLRIKILSYYNNPRDEHFKKLFSCQYDKSIFDLNEGEYFPSKKGFECIYSIIEVILTNFCGFKEVNKVEWLYLLRELFEEIGSKSNRLPNLNDLVAPIEANIVLSKTIRNELRAIYQFLELIDAKRRFGEGSVGAEEFNQSSILYYQHAEGLVFYPSIMEIYATHLLSQNRESKKSIIIDDIPHRNKSIYQLRKQNENISIAHIQQGVGDLGYNEDQIILLKMDDDREISSRYNKNITTQGLCLGVYKTNGVYDRTNFLLLDINSGEIVDDKEVILK